MLREEMMQRDFLQVIYM